MVADSVFIKQLSTSNPHALNRVHILPLKEELSPHLRLTTQQWSTVNSLPPVEVSCTLLICGAPGRADGSNPSGGVPPVDQWFFFLKAVAFLTLDLRM
jgi:hypothetical protein